MTSLNTNFDYQIFDGFMDGVIVLSSSHEVKYLNASAASTLHLKSLKQVLSKSILTVFPVFEKVLQSPDEHFAFQEVTFHVNPTQRQLVLLVGVKTLPQTSEILLYIRDVTIEVTLQSKFAKEKEEKQKAIQNSEKDLLTGCLNKAGLFNRLSAQWEKVQSKELPLSLIVLDLDGFKKINDRHGHQAGDWFLSKLSEAIRGSLEDTEDVSRFGGDEFVVLSYHSDETKALGVAKNIMETIEAFKLYYHGSYLSVTASIGVCVYDSSIKTWNDLFKLADMSSYLSKNAGGNRISVHQPKKTLKASE